MRIPVTRSTLPECGGHPGCLWELPRTQSMESTQLEVVSRHGCLVWTARHGHMCSAVGAWGGGSPRAGERSLGWLQIHQLEDLRLQTIGKMQPEVCGSQCLPIKAQGSDGHKEDSARPHSRVHFYVWLFSS